MASFAVAALAISGAAALPGWGKPSSASSSPTPTQPAYAGAGTALKGQDPTTNTNTSPSAVYAAQATATAAHEVSYVRGAAFDRFISIYLENTDYDKAAADPNLAWLATKGITLQNYYGVTHPSEPNYCAAVGGDNFGMDADSFNFIEGNVSSVIDLLEARGISWATYQEDMPYTGFEGFAWVNQETKANDYVRKHNPPVLFDANTTPQRLTYQKNLTLFYQDLEQHKLPQWSFITPNMTNDGHDTSVTVAGAWSRSFLEPLLSNEYFMDRTLILLTFDENETYTIGNRVFTILLGGAVAGHAGKTDASYYNHYSDISTVEANWNLDTLGRWDVGANVFQVVGQQTGDAIRPNLAVTGPNETVFQNTSFAGPFNTEFQTAGYPAPNVNLVSPNGRRHVAPFIQEVWGHSDLSTYYTDSVVIPDGAHPPPGYAINDS